MLSMVTFVVVYSNVASKELTKRQIEHFVSTTVTMEHVSENYLEGEQRICDVWAHYINSVDMNMDEAISFIKSSHVLETASAHIVYADESLSGRSTKTNKTTGSDVVNYKSIGLLDDVSWIHEMNPEVVNINVSHAYTNPTNGNQSIAFGNFIKLSESGVKKDAILLRVMPISELIGKWVFPHEEFVNAEFSIIDSNGEFIIRGSSFKKGSAGTFFDYYRRYNKKGASSSELDDLFKEIITTVSSLTMYDAHGEECILSHTPFTANGDWILLSFMPMKYLTSNTENWLLIGIVTAGLVLLFIFDLAFMLYFNKKLKNTAVEAESANRAKTIFLSTMSHDIRTPMNAIIGLTTIAEKNIGDDELVKENLRKISLASNHLLTLINDILDISKVESGKLSLCPQTFSIVETVENLVNISQPMIKDKNINFNFRVSRVEKEYLFADQLRLNQIFINILSNAIKYTEPGGSVNVDLKEEESEKPECVRLTYKVSDTGIGMTPEFMANMYQPFLRQTDSRVNKIQGTGLGLAITKQMVNLMEGTIDCQSEVGKGTTFIITLDVPISDHQVVEMKFDSLNVLLVDDDEILLETAKDTLESLGLKVELTRNGADAIEMIKNRNEKGDNYNLLIIDMKMPEMDGIETIRQIRQELKLDIPILLTSAYSWSDVEEKAKEFGVNGFLSKPLFRSTLYNKISEILGTEAQLSESENDYSDLNGLNILVAEDNDINWEIVSTLLSMYGINTERAENGRICVEKMKEAKEDSYALIFMDIQMPEMNGLEATKAIRKLDNSWACSIPIIAMTADAFSENIAECLNAGMNGHIAKPIDIKIIIKEIRRIMEESKK